MTFATAKELPSSRRFMLVRITPARYVGDDLSDEGSGIYSMTWPFNNVAKVERNGSELTKVETVANNDEYSFDETTRELKMKIAAAPSAGNPLVTDNVIVVFYRLFYTGENCVVAPEDPSSAESASNPMRSWEPRLEKYPTIRQSVGNALAGILSYDSTKLEIVNVDNRFEQYLTINDSFYQKDVDIWLCIDGVKNIKRIYRGLVSGIRKSDVAVTIDVLDNFSRLNQSCYMGDTADDCYGDDTNSAQSNKPIPYLVGDISRYSVLQNQNIQGLDTSAPMLDPESMLEGLCTSYNSANSTSVNRTWSLCRTNSEGFQNVLNGETETIDTVITIVSSDKLLEITYPEGQRGTMDKRYWEFFHYLRIGDTVSITPTGEGVSTLYGIVTYVSTGRMRVFIQHGDPDTIDSGDTLTFKSQTAIVITNGGQSWYPCEGRDYTLSEETLASGNKLLKVTFENDFEQYHPGLDALTPDTVQVRFRTMHGGYLGNPGPSDAWRHQNVLEKICSYAGLSVSSSSFSGGSYDFDTRLQFSIPYFDQGEIGSFRLYAEDILKTMLGYIKLNEDLEAEYLLFESPSSGNTVDSSTQLGGSVSTSIVYEDIATTVIVENPHNLQDNSDRRVNAKAKHLHGIDRQTTIRVLAKDPRTTRFSSFMGTRRAIYRWETATEHLDALIGDQLTFESPQILGGSGSDNLQIITLDKGTDKTSVEATDLEGI